MLYNSAMYKPQLIHRKQYLEMSSVIRKPTFCICKNKDADQLHGNRAAD